MVPKRQVGIKNEYITVTFVNCPYSSANLNLIFYANLMFVDVFCRQKMKVNFARRCQDWAKN